jgi:hypothetical protein
MATVPGTPDNVLGIHPAFKPTQADFLQAAAIMHGLGKFDEGKFQMAGVMPRGVKPIPTDRGLGPYDDIERMPQSARPAGGHIELET